MPFKEEREYRKAVELRIAPNEGEDKSYMVEGYATTFNDAYELWREPGYIVKERVDPQAFNETDMADVVFQIDHCGRVYARTSNSLLKLVADSHGLKTSADLGKTSSARSVFEDIEAGNYHQMSFAFTVKKDSYDEEELDDGTVVVTRNILKVGKLYDVSAVSFPANPNTDISARSKDLIDGEIKRFEAERLHAKEIEEARQALKDQISRLKGVSNG